MSELLEILPREEWPEELSYSTWWKPGGGMMYNREFLGPEHPEQLYNYIRREFRVDPEAYGIEKPPVSTKCPHCGGILDDPRDNG